MACRTPPRRMYSRELPLHRFAKIENEKNEKLDRNWVEKAEQELDETAEKTRARITQLRHMLAVTDRLPHGRRDDAFLLRFLRAKKFDVEKAYKMTCKYFTMKQQSPELFKVSPISQLNEFFKMQIQWMLPNRDPSGRLLYIFRVEKCDPYKCPVESIFRLNVLALENAIREPETQISGIIVLLDMTGAGLGHAKFLAPNLSRKTVEVIQEAFPLRFKAFHIINQPFYFDAVLAVLKPFLKEKIRKRIYLHGSNLDSLHKHIPKDILPIEYGGAQSAFDNTIWRKSILTEAEYFHHLEWYRNSWIEDEDDQSCCDDGGSMMSESGSTINVKGLNQFLIDCADDDEMNNDENDTTIDPCPVTC